MFCCEPIRFWLMKMSFEQPTGRFIPVREYFSVKEKILEFFLEILPEKAGWYREIFAPDYGAIFYCLKIERKEYL